MVRGLAFTSLFHSKHKDTSPPPPAPTTAAWVWPSCKHPRTQSFRAPAARTIASIFLDSAESSFTNSSGPRDCSESFSTASEASADDAVARGLRSDRLFFDLAGESTSSILETRPPFPLGGSGEAFGGGVAVAFESEDPYVDFRTSMEEMVAAHGVGGWRWLEEMLGWYLRANGKDTHGAIVSAFVDLVLAVSDPACASCSCRTTSFTFAEEEVQTEEESTGTDHASFGLR